jgi:hypothetical protein
MAIEEGEEVQAKGICNIFNKIITENFPNLEKTMPIQVQEASRTPNRADQNRTSIRHIIIKATITESRERILKAVREKKQITCKGKPIKNHSRLFNRNIKSNKINLQKSLAFLYTNNEQTEKEYMETINSQ